MKATRELFGFGVLPFILGGIIFLPAWVFLSALAFGLIGAGHEMLLMARCESRPCGYRLPLLLIVLVMASSWYFGPPALIIMVAVTLIVLPSIQMTHPETPKGSLNAVAGVTPRRRLISSLTR